MVVVWTSITVSHLPFLLNSPFKYARGFVLCSCVCLCKRKCYLSQVWLNGHEAHNHTWQAAFQKVCVRHTFFSGSHCQKAVNLPMANKLCFVFFVWNSKDSFYTLSTPTRQRHSGAFTETFCKQSSTVPINPGWKEGTALQGCGGGFFLMINRFLHTWTLWGENIEVLEI